MPKPSESIRNAALASALDQATQGGRATLYAALARLSGLPGPTANWAVAEAVGRHLAKAGETASPVIEMLARPSGQGGASPACAFFPICAAHALSYSYLDAAADSDRLRRISALRDIADDTRHLVRDGVVRALWIIGRSNAPDLIEVLSDWMTDFLPAAVALEAMAGRVVLDAVRRPELPLLRLSESLDLVAYAARADQRSQGYRLLLRTMALTSRLLMARFPAATQAWFEPRIRGENQDHRRAIEQMLEALPDRADAEGLLRPLEQAIEVTAPPPRDPRSYVGPTRRRGARK